MTQFFEQTGPNGCTGQEDCPALLTSVDHHLSNCVRWRRACDQQFECEYDQFVVGHVLSHPTPAERVEAGWKPDGTWEEVSNEPYGFRNVTTVCNGFGNPIEVIKLPQYKITRRRPWVRITIEREYEYETRIE